ncbi:MAG: SH3 domain-containing protein, partial [bacterium]
SILSSDIRFIKPDKDVLEKEEGLWYHNPLFIWWHLVPFLALGGLLYHRKRKASVDVSGSRWRKAHKTALKSLAAAEKSSEPAEFYAAVSRSMYGYIGDKFNLSSTGLTTDDVNRLLSAGVKDQDTVTMVIRLLEEADFARFATSPSNKDKMEQFVQGAKEALIRLDKILVVILLYVFLGATGSYAADMGATRYNQANKQYRDQNFTEAVKSYADLVESGYRDPDLLYNLGNAYFKVNQVGKAILYYKKSQIFSPRDKDIQKNLEYARMLTSVSASGKKLNFKELLDLVVNRFSFSEGFFIFEIFFLLMATGLFFRLLLEREKMKKVSGWLLGVGIPGLLLIGGLLAHKGYYQAYQTRAVVIRAKAEGFSGPGRKYTKLFSAPEGTELVVHSERGNWFQVVLETGYNGWVKSTDLGVI